MSLRHRHKRRQAEAQRIAQEVAQRLNPQPIDNLMQLKRNTLDDFADMLRFNHELLSKPQSKTQVPQGHDAQARSPTGRRR